MLSTLNYISSMLIVNKNCVSKLNQRKGISVLLSDLIFAVCIIKQVTFKIVLDVGSGVKEMVSPPPLFTT